MGESLASMCGRMAGAGLAAWVPAMRRSLPDGPEDIEDIQEFHFPIPHPLLPPSVREDFIHGVAEEMEASWGRRVFVGVGYVPPLLRPWVTCVDVALLH